ncbi:MAG: hypothetical protein NVS4B12_06460 [Ktedonobacteraceae bacterium]
MTINIITLDDAQQVEPIQESIIDIYREAFGQAPYFKNEADVRSFSTTLPRHMQRDGFRCVVVMEDAAQDMLGFAYGYTGEPGQWWHDLVRRKMTPEDAEYWMTNVFEVVELAVRPSAHGLGYGGRIHDALLQGLPHRTATLSTYQVETTALKMYEKHGWFTLLSNFIFPGYTKPYRIMGKLLP